MLNGFFAVTIISHGNLHCHMNYVNINGSKQIIVSRGNLHLLSSIDVCFLDITQCLATLKDNGISNHPQYHFVELIPEFPMSLSRLFIQNIVWVILLDCRVNQQCSTNRILLDKIISLLMCPIILVGQSSYMWYTHCVDR